MDTFDKINVLISTSDSLIEELKSNNLSDDTSQTIIALWNEARLLLGEVNLHVKNNTYIGSKLLGRELYEIFLYLKYMIEDDTDFRALCYMYVSFIRNTRLTRYFISGTDENNEIKNSSSILSNKLIIDYPNAPSYLSSQEVIINDTKFDSVRAIMQNMSGRDHKKDWYHIASKNVVSNVISNIRELAKSQNLEYTYITFYAPYSEQMHGMNSFKNFYDVSINRTTNITDSNIVIEFSRDIILRILKYFGNKFGITKELITIALKEGYGDLVSDDLKPTIESLKQIYGI